MLLSVIPVLLVGFVLGAIDPPNVAFQWKQLDFQYPSQQKLNDALRLKEFIPENNLPLGIEIYKDRIFITVPRWKEGVPASLTYIKRTGHNKSPELQPYPNWDAHNQKVQTPQIVSPFRIRADSCGRLWVLDSGRTNIANNFTYVINPKLMIFDLSTDTLIHSYTIPDNHLDKENSLFANIAVEENNCSDSFAYLGDLGQPALEVYDFKQKRSWSVKNEYFNHDPATIPITVAGISLNWTDGIFGLALSDKDSEGYSTLYFHPLNSFNEYSVSTKVLRNESLATNQKESKNHYKLLGTRGPKSQSGASFIHKKTGVLFYAVLQLNAVSCWRTSLPKYEMDAQGNVFFNSTLVVFPNDIKVDANDTLWVISDKLSAFLQNTLDYQEYNFRILNATVKDAIEGTQCASKMKKDPHIMNDITLMAKTKTSSGSNNKADLYLLSLLSIMFLYLFAKM